MREKYIEQKLVKAVRSRGGIALKLVCPGYSGMPDRLVLFRNNLCFVELKAPGKKPGPMQMKRHEMLRGLGFKVYVIDGTDQVGGILDEIQAS